MDHCVSFGLLFSLILSFFGWQYLISPLVSSNFSKRGATPLSTIFQLYTIIYWWSVVLVEETGVPGENHQPVPGHWQISEHNLHAMQNICCFLGVIVFTFVVYISLHTKYAIEAWERLFNIRITGKPARLKCTCIKQITIYKGQFPFLHLMNLACNRTCI